MLVGYRGPEGCQSLVRLVAGSQRRGTKERAKRALFAGRLPVLGARQQVLCLRAYRNLVIEPVVVRDASIFATR